MTDDNTTQSALARAGLGNPMGKLMDELKTKVDPDTALAFRKIAHEADSDTAGVLRDFVYKLVHGETYTDMCIREAKVKRDKLFGIGQARGPAGAHE
jgi:hypothetical protein